MKDKMHKIGLRLVKESDIDLLYEWAIDAKVRENAFHQETFDYETHKRWFNKMMSDSNEIQFIYEYNGQPIGQIRLSISGEIAEIGYSVQEKYRGRGHGKVMLSLVQRTVKDKYPQIAYLTAKVKPYNVASINAFKDVGFGEEYHYFKLDTCQDLDVESVVNSIKSV